MRIVISDNTGYIGNVIEHLLKDGGVDIIPLNKIDGADLSQPDFWKKIPRAEHFIHLDSLVHVPSSYDNPYMFYRYNYMTTLNALEYCRKCSCHLIYSGSYIYGKPDYLPVDECHTIKPFNPYARTKAISEELCEGYNRDFGVKVSILRLFNVYGEGQKGGLLLPEILEQIKKGMTKINLKSGSSRRDFVYVEDVAKAFIASINDHNDYSIYNICSGSSCSIKELTEIINNALGNQLSFTFSESDRVNEVDETVGSYDKIFNELGWKPKVSLAEGITRTVKSELHIL